MPKFNYEAVDSHGKSSKGALVAESVREAILMLDAKGLYPLHVNPTRKTAWIALASFWTFLIACLLSIFVVTLSKLEAGFLTAGFRPRYQAFRGWGDFFDKAAIFALILFLVAVALGHISLFQPSRRYAWLGTVSLAVFYAIIAIHLLLLVVD